MKSMLILLNVSKIPAIKKRQVTWTVHSTHVIRFVGFRHFLLKFGFTAESGEGYGLVFNEAMLSRITNINEMEIGLNGSKRGRVAMQPCRFLTPTSRACQC